MTRARQISLDQTDNCTNVEKAMHICCEPHELGGTSGSNSCGSRSPARLSMTKNGLQLVERPPPDQDEPFNKDAWHYRLQALKETQPADSSLVDKLERTMLDALAKPYMMAMRMRINPYEWASTLMPECNPEALIGVFFYGVQAGVFDMMWDLRCEHCNMIVSEVDNLKKLRIGQYFCTMCEVPTSSFDFLTNVDVRFTVVPEVEKIVSCFPGCVPLPKLGSKFNLVSWPHHEESAEELLLECGDYTFYCPITMARGYLHVVGEPTDQLQEYVIEQRVDCYSIPDIQVRPGRVRLTLRNEVYPVSAIRLVARGGCANEPLDYDRDLPCQQLSGLECLHHPVYQRLFGSSAISERERVRVSNCTYMFSDIVGSTAMYEALGDVRAYNAVKDHFEIIFKAVRSNRGYVVKTIGDAVMSSFTRSRDAVRAAKHTLVALQAYNAQKPLEERIRIKTGIHSGPSMLVCLNDRMDYFGQNINKTARVQGSASSDEISMTEAIFNDKQAMDSLALPPECDGLLGWSISSELVNLKGLSGRIELQKARLVQLVHTPRPSHRHHMHQTNLEQHSSFKSAKT